MVAKIEIVILGALAVPFAFFTWMMLFEMWCATKQMRDEVVEIKELLRKMRSH